ncbi:Cytochrome p450, partial [Thalictrum thalictroides]
YRFLPTKKHRRMKEINREMRTLLGNMITKREKVMKAGQVQNNDLLGLLMESNFNEMSENTKNAGITIDEVIDECKLFYLAGQETSATLLVWTMICLGIHQDWQEKAREEVWQVFRGQSPDFEGLNHLKIVPMILNEVLRLYTPAVTLLRVTYKEMKLGKLVLPPGVQLSLPGLMVHHDHELWGEDAEEFNPGRFSEGISKATNNKVSFFPFSWGPRICIGQNFALTEAKMAISMILQHFSFELSATYVHAPHTVITLNPQHGAQLILHKV